MNKKTLGVIGLIIVILVVVLLSSTKNNENIKIVALYPLTGGVASWGESSQKSTQIAVDEINSSGGINGKKLEVIYADHKCDPKIALSEYQKYISSVKILTSSSCSGTVLSLAPNLQKDNAVLLATIVASAKISGISPVVYRNWTVENRQAQLLGGKIKELGVKKIGVIYEETDYGKGLKLALEDFLKDSNITIVSESFPSGSTDVRTQLTKLKGANIDAIFLSPQTETSSEVLLSQIEQLGIKVKMFANDIIFGSNSLVEKHKTLLQGTFGSNYTITSNKLNDFLAKYKARYGVDCAHTNGCAIAYDSMYMLANAIKEGGNSAEAVAKYLQSIKYEGVSGVTSFDKNNDRDGIGYVLSTVNAGKIELVK